MTATYENIHAQIVSALQEMDTEVVNGLCLACSSFAGELQDYCWYTLGFDFVDELFNGNTQHALAALLESSVNMADAYIRFDAHGTLESTNKPEFDSYDLEEIAHAILRGRYTLNLPAELIAILGGIGAYTLDTLVAEYLEGEFEEMEVWG